MAFRKELYPKNWKEIVARILKRSKNKCEFCGAENYKPHPVTESKVVLSVAHLDHNPNNCAENNIKAACQRCHLSYDSKQHIKNKRETQHKNKIAASQPASFVQGLKESRADFLNMFNATSDFFNPAKKPESNHGSNTAKKQPKEKTARQR